MAYEEHLYRDGAKRQALCWKIGSSRNPPLSWTLFEGQHAVDEMRGLLVHRRLAQDGQSLTYMRNERAVLRVPPAPPPRKTQSTAHPARDL